MKEKMKKKPSLGLSIAVFLSILVVLSVGVAVFKMDVISLILLCLIATFGVSMTLGYSMDDLFSAMGTSLKNASVSLLFFVIIGMLVGSWILSGTVPSLIYYGLSFITPGLFLPLGFVACCVTAFVTGTSWGTAGTIGIALMGMGTGMGIPMPVIAGMVVSGAAFGDYLSPMSDTTILASQAAKIDLYRHVKSMSLTLFPAVLISIVIYAFLGTGYNNAYDATTTNEILAVLKENFNISWVTMIPIVMVLIMSVLKMPSIPVLLLGVLVGGIVAVFTQGVSVADFINALNSGFSRDTGNEMVNTLVNRGGIQSMMWTFSLAFLGLMLSGILEEVGYLKVLVSSFADKIKNTGALVTCTYLTGVVGCMAMAEVYLSIILNGSLFRDVYEEKEVDPAVLSRTLEEGATLAGPMVPWTTCGAFMAGTLGVSTLSFIPYMFMNYLAPLLSIVCAFLGIAIYKNKKKQKETV